MIHIKKAITILCLIIIILIAPFWMAIAGFIDAIEEIYALMKTPKRCLNTLYKNIWGGIKKASEK